MEWGMERVKLKELDILFALEKRKGFYHALKILFFLYAIDQIDRNFCLRLR